MSWNPTGWGDAPGDSPSARLGKRTVILEQLVSWSILLVLVPLLAAGGFGLAALWCGGCVAAWWANVVWLRIGRRFGLYLAVSTALGPMFLVPFVTLLRGVPGSEMMAVWCLVPPISAALFGKLRRTVILAILAILAIAAIVTLDLSSPLRAVPAWLSWALPVFLLSGGLVQILLQILPLGVGRRDLARALAVEHARSERLLLNVLPAPIAERLKGNPSHIAEQFEAVTVLFADIVGFTPLSESMTPQQLVEALDDLFSAFDDIAQRQGLEKIKTIGDAYMVVGGVPNRRPDHAPAVARMALEMIDLLEGQSFRGHRLRMRIGIHSGPVVAGVIGKKKFIYDLWGDTVNTASRMESHGDAGRIQVTDACRSALGDAFAFEERGVVEIKGKGPMHTWWLVRRAGPSLPT